MIIRTYGCDVCGDTFEVTLENGAAPDPECPYCRDVVLQWRPGMFAIGTNKGKAMDIAQKIVEEDYGLTNMRDNNREGDIAAHMPVQKQAGELDAIMQAQSEIAQQRGVELTDQQKKQAAGFWGGGSAGAALPAANVLPTARAAMKEANASGANPMEMLHRSGKEGKLPTGFRVIARA